MTGAASGNGRAIAVRFAEEGADMVIGDLDVDGMEETAELVRNRDRDAVVVRCDVTNRSDVQALVDAAERLDVMVANAGVAGGSTFLDLTDDEWQRVLDVNLTGVFVSNQLAARRMVEQAGGGAIINIASIMAEQGSAGAPHYSASKAGVKSLTRSAALALAQYNIRVNAIGPGYIETAMTQMIRDEPIVEKTLISQTPLGRIGEPIVLPTLRFSLPATRASS